MRWTMHVCTVVLGKIASIASGNPLSPSTHAIRMSCTPRCLRSLRTCIQNFAPSVSSKPHPEHVAVAVDADAQGEVAGAALNAAALADLQDQAVEEHDRVDVFKRPFPPRRG